MAVDIITPDQVARERAQRVANARENASLIVRDEAEKTIVARIAQLARKYDAMSELAELELTIPNLLQLAAAKQVTDADLQEVKADVAILVLDLLAKEGGAWADCWEGLKSRFLQWMQEINNNNE